MLYPSQPSRSTPSLLPLPPNVSFPSPPHSPPAPLRFVEHHSRLLNAYVRRSPALLEGSLAPLMRVHKLIDFDNKRLWFRSKVRQHDHGRPYGSLRINIRCVCGGGGAGVNVLRCM